MTRQFLNKLEDEGDISAEEVKNFFKVVRSYYHTGTEYA